MNLFAFVEGDAVTGLDAYGLWKAWVHDFLTAWWVFSTGYPHPSDWDIGKACNAVDYLAPGGTGPAPVVGDLSYHFDRDAPLGGLPDSRLRHKNEHYVLAMEACSDQLGNDDPKEAVKQLGLALHPLQDYFAHGDYGRLNTTTVAHFHNETSPQVIPGHGSPVDYPDDPTLDAVARTGAGAVIIIGRPDTTDGATPHTGHITGRGDDVWYEFVVTGASMRIRDTEAATRAVAGNYRSYLSVGATKCCKCLKYFGVKP